MIYSSSAEEDDSSEQESNYEQDHTSDQQEGSSDEHDGGSSEFDKHDISSGQDDEGSVGVTMKVFLLMTLLFSKLCIKKQKKTWERFPLASSSQGCRGQVRQRPGLTQYATREYDNISSSFQLFFQPSLLYYYRENNIQWNLF